MIKIKIDLWLFQFDLQIGREKKSVITSNFNAEIKRVERMAERILTPLNN